MKKSNSHARHTSSCLWIHDNIVRNYGKSNESEIQAYRLEAKILNWNVQAEVQEDGLNWKWIVFIGPRTVAEGRTNTLLYAQKDGERVFKEACYELLNKLS